MRNRPARRVSSPSPLPATRTPAGPSSPSPSSTDSTRGPWTCRAQNRGASIPTASRRRRWFSATARGSSAPRRARLREANGPRLTPPRRVVTTATVSAGKRSDVQAISPTPPRSNSRKVLVVIRVPPGTGTARVPALADLDDDHVFTDLEDALPGNDQVAIPAKQ